MLICEQLSEDYCDSIPVDVIPVSSTPPGDARDNALDKAFNVVLPRELAKVEAALGNKKFLTGESLSMADFYWGNCYVSVLTNPKFYEPERRAETLRRFPKFTAYGKRFEAEFISYLKSRPQTPMWKRANKVINKLKKNKAFWFVLN